MKYRPYSLSNVHLTTVEANLALCAVLDAAHRLELAIASEARRRESRARFLEFILAADMIREMRNAG